MTYEHIVYIEEKEGKVYLCIDRVLEQGKRHFMSHYELPGVQSESQGFELMSKTAEWLGNSVLIDSPKFREHIGISD